MPRHAAMVRRRRLDILIPHALIKTDVALLAHQVDACLVARRHVLHEPLHHQVRKALALILGVQDHGHDDHVGSRRVVPHQFLECLVGHHHVIGTTAVDEPNHLALELHDLETFVVLRDAQGDLLLCGSFVPLIGGGFNLEAALRIGGQGVAEGGLRQYVRHGSCGTTLKSAMVGEPRAAHTALCSSYSESYA